MDLGSGITFDIFTHGKPRVVFFFFFCILFYFYFFIFFNDNKHIVHIDDLEDGYNVACS